MPAQDTGPDPYLTGVQHKIWALWNQQIKSGFDHPVEVTFTILGDGSVTDVKVTEPSGSAPLDMVAQKTILNAAPFGPFPKDYGADRKTITAVFRPGDWFLDSVVSKIRTLSKAGITSDSAYLVGVTFSILADGSVTDVTVAQPSGDHVLDEAAQRAVLDAAPFGPLPMAYGSDRKTILVVFGPSAVSGEWKADSVPPWQYRGAPAPSMGQRLDGFRFDPRGADFTLWLYHLKNEILRNWVTPQAAELGTRGRVDFEFTVERDGSISALRMVTSSGTAALDKAAEQAVKRSRPKPLPDDYRPERLTIQVPFYYNESPSTP